MSPRTCLAVVLCGLLSNCTSVPLEPPALPDLPHEPPPVTLPAPDLVPPPPVPPPPPVVVPSVAFQAMPKTPAKHGKKTQANLLTPRNGGHRDPDSNLLTYPYRPGAMYLVTAAPRHPVTLLLPQGVRLSTQPVLNDKQDETGEWDIGYPKVGENLGKVGEKGGETTGEDYQEAITLRPVKAGIEATTPLPTKTGQVFLLRLKTQDKPGDLLVTWEMPPGSLPHARRLSEPDDSPVRRGGYVPPPAINLARLHARYLIERGEKPVAWLPVEAYDDGSLTVLRFAEALSYTRAPQLVRLTPDHTKPLPLEYTVYRVPTQPQKGEFFIARGIHPRLRLLDGTGAYVDIIRIEETVDAVPPPRTPRPAVRAESE